jgi:hypothetical protein
MKYHPSNKLLNPAFTKAVMPFALQIARQHIVHLLAGRYT